MASFGRPGSSTDNVLEPFTDVDDIVEPRTLTSAEIQLLRVRTVYMHTLVILASTKLQFVYVLSRIHVLPIVLVSFLRWICLC